MYSARSPIVTIGTSYDSILFFLDRVRQTFCWLVQNGHKQFSNLETVGTTRLAVTVVLTEYAVVLSYAHASTVYQWTM